MAILSQLFWGVTVGALSGTVAAIAKLFAVAGCAVGSGFAIFHWRKLRAKLGSRRR